MPRWSAARSRARTSRARALAPHPSSRTWVALLRGGGGLVQRLGDAALVARGGVGVDGADLGGLVDALHRIDLGLLLLGFGRGEDALDGALHARACVLVHDALLLALMVAFQGLLAVSHV